MSALSTPYGVYSRIPSTYHLSSSINALQYIRHSPSSQVFISPTAEPVTLGDSHSLHTSLHIKIFQFVNCP